MLARGVPASRVATATAAPAAAATRTAAAPATARVLSRRAREARVGEPIEAVEGEVRQVLGAKGAAADGGARLSRVRG